MDYIDCLVLTVVTNGRFVISESNDSPLFLTMALRIKEDFYIVLVCCLSLPTLVLQSSVRTVRHHPFSSVPKEQPCQGLLKKITKKKRRSEWT